MSCIHRLEDFEFADLQEQYVGAMKMILALQKDNEKLLESCKPHLNERYMSVCRANGELHIKIEELKARVQELEKKLTSILHITNCYDGNYAKACDDIAELVSGALKVERGE